MILEEHRGNPDQINPIDQINQEEVQALRVHQADLRQIDRHLRIDHLHRVHQADLQEVALLRVHQVGQADLVIQIAIEQEVRDQVEAEVHGLEKMNNAMIAALN